MIVLDQKDLTSQEGMERGLDRYFADVQKSCDGTFNARLDPELISCDYEGRSLTLRLALCDWMANPGGVLHGGMSAAALDMTMGVLSRYFSGGGMTPTVSMSVNYQHPGVIGGQLMIRAELISCGSTLCHAAARAWMEDAPERTVCTGTAVYYTGRRDGGK